jgi:protein-S-isoprenylcysteine O-methyltransferase Ste14
VTGSGTERGPAPPPASGADAAAADAAPGAFVRLGRFFFGRRDFVFAAVFLAVVFLSAPRPFLQSLAADAWLDAAGFAIALLGQALRALVIGLAYIRRGGKDRKIYADVLVQDGFFAHCRNPLYVGNALVYLGLFVILNSAAGWLVGVPFFALAYLSITAAEEDFLRRRFGAAYEDYCRRVPRFVPDLRGLGATVRGMRFGWKRLVRKEYGSTFAWLTAALGLLVRESVAWRGADASGPLLRPVLLAWGILVAAYGVARWLKKTRRLADA